MSEVVIAGLMSVESYDAFEAKLMASVSWLITRIFGDNIPDALIVPYYTDDQNRIRLKPSTVNALTSGELYCSAAANVFRDMGFLNQNHTIVLNALKRCGIEVVEPDRCPVTETVLTQTAPFRINAHLAVIDALISANIREQCNIDRIVDALKRYSKSELREIPCSTEDAFVLWINTICSVVKKEVKAKPIKNAQFDIPKVGELYEDICDGACLATLLSFYSNQELPLSAVCFDDNLSIADCLHNLQLIKSFCLKSFRPNIYHFANYEDILYAEDSLKMNINAFLADLFCRLECYDGAKSPVASSSAKRHFERVSIPDLRPLEKDSIMRLQNSRPNRFSYHASLPVKETMVVTPSTEASMMNSTDSLMTQRSFDSLSCVPFYAAGQTPSQAVGPCMTFADHARRLHEYGDLNASQCLDKATESDPKSSFETDGCKKPPLWSIKMQLDEKKRQIASQRLQEKSERAQQDQATSREAFLKLIGKFGQPSATSDMQPANTIAQAKETSALLPCNNGIEKANVATSAQAAGDKRDVIGEISNSIKEIKQQMKQLAAEQQQIQRMLTTGNAKLSPTEHHTSEPTALPSYAPSALLTKLQSPKASLPVLKTSTTTPEKQIESASDNAALIPEQNDPLSINAHLLMTRSMTDDSSHLATLQPLQSTLERRSLSPTNVGYVFGEDTTDNELGKKREFMVASALKRKAMLERRRDEIEDEYVHRQEELNKEKEMEKQRKKEKELQRMKIFDEYQKRKAEAAASDQAWNAQKMPPTSSLSRLNQVRGPRPVSEHLRPMSQGLLDKEATSSRTLTSSVDNIDQFEIKSQDSDGYGSSLLISEPSIKPFVKPTQKSNRALIFNALEHSVFAGEVNKEKKLKCLQELAKSDKKHFLVLFRDQKCQFRGMYTWDQVSNTVQKIYGLGPSYCSEHSLRNLFKYDSGSKKFIEIPARHFSANTDGFTVADEFWHKKKQLYSKSSTMTC